MRPLLVFGLGLAVVFASTFLILALFGGFGWEEARSLAQAAAKVDPLWVGLLIVGLLFADLFVAMPTLTLCIVSGYYLGPGHGGGVAATGMMLAGVCGYGISSRFGSGLLLRLCRDEAKRREAVELFAQRGPIVLLLCRAAPILPEVSCCLAGCTRMPFGRFLIFFSLATVPYAFVAAFAGASSSLEDARPALYVAIGISLGLWLLWWSFVSSWRRTRSR